MILKAGTYRWIYPGGDEPAPRRYAEPVTHPVCARCSAELDKTKAVKADGEYFCFACYLEKRR